MSYGFGTTFGTGATDLITWQASTVLTVQTSWLAWVWIENTGGAGFPRVFNFDDGTRILDNAAANMQFTPHFDAGDGIWDFPYPGFGAWHHLAIVYDGGSTANHPVIYIDGVSQTVTPVSAPSGTFVTTATAWRLGNRAAQDRVWMGRLAEVARVTRLISAGEAASQAGGQSAGFLSLSGSDRYVKLINSVVDEVNSETGTVVGALVDASHPAITYPSGGARRRDGMLLGLGIG